MNQVHVLTVLQQKMRLALTETSITRYPL
jgi:hypothetical protein